MLLAHIPDVTPMAVLLLFFVCVALFVMLSKVKGRALAVAFTLVCAGLSLFLLHLIMFRQ
jgi:hypothetical protein